MPKNNYRGDEKVVFCRPTWAEVDLGRLADNFSLLRSKAGKGVKIMPMVKADAYGHGMLPCARKLVECGADYLGVASIEEGILLRHSGINVPVLVLGAVLSGSVSGFFDSCLMPTLCDWKMALALDSEARRRRTKIKVHIKIDTGMGRLGVLWQDAVSFVKKVGFLDHLEVEGIFTHFPCADDGNNSFTDAQEKKFFWVVQELAASGLKIPLLHASNSAAILNRSNPGFNMVRPGLALYGISPFKGAAGYGLKPVLSLKSQVVYVKNMPAGAGISYGHTYKTVADCTVATLPIGYGDGYPRNLSNCGPVLIKGRRFKVSGRVCMDQLMVDLAETVVSAGEESVLIGNQGKERITAQELADLSGTIPYEILCGIGSRVPRVYVKARVPHRTDKWREKRVFNRFSLRMRLHFSCPGSGISGEAETRDISAAGLSFVTRADAMRRNNDLPFDEQGRFTFPESSRINIRLQKRGSEEILRTSGDVAWSRSLGSQECGAGIAFQRINLPAISKLMKFLD